MVFVAVTVLWCCGRDAEVVDISKMLPPPTEVKMQIEGSNRILVTWKDNSENEKFFIVQRIEGTQYFTYKNIATLPSNITRFTDTTVTPRTIYNYKIVAQDQNGFTSASEETFNSEPTPSLGPQLSVTSISQPFSASINTWSAAQTFTLTSSHLNNNIRIVSPPNFRISLGGNTSYKDTITIVLSPSGGIIQSVDVKYLPTTNGPHADSIIVSSGALVRKVFVQGNTQ